MSGYESDTCGRSYTIRIRYVWTQIFLYPHKNICGYKNLRIRVDGALCFVLSPLSFHLYSSLPNLQLFAPLFRYPSSHWHSYEPCMLTHFWPVPLHWWFPCLHSSTSEAKHSVSRFAFLCSKKYELKGFQETNFKLFNLVFKWMEKWKKKEKEKRTRKRERNTRKNPFFPLSFRQKGFVGSSESQMLFFSSFTS